MTLSSLAALAAGAGDHAAALEFYGESLAAFELDPVALVETRVRDAVRAAGIDPLRDPDSVRALVDAAITDSLVDGPLQDAVALGTSVFHSVAGFGPLQPYFDDPEVEELWINAPGRVFVARNGRSELTTVVLDDAQVRDLVERMLRISGRRLDLSSPFVDAMLPDGSRLHVAIPDITREHWAVNVRRFVVRARTVGDLVGLGMLSTQAAAFLDAAVVSGLNIVVAGGTQSGQDHVPQRPARVRAGHRARHHLRGGLRDRAPAPRLGRPPDARREPRGNGRGPVAASRPRGTAHAPDPAGGGRGAAGGVARPPRRDEQRDAVDGDAARQQRARGGHQAVHASAARGAEHRGRLRAAHRRRVRRPGRPSCVQPVRATRGARGRRTLWSGGGRRGRAVRCLRRSRRRSPRARAASRRTRSGSGSTGSTSWTSSPRRTASGSSDERARAHWRPARPRRGKRRDPRRAGPADHEGGPAADGGRADEARLGGGRPSPVGARGWSRPASSPPCSRAPSH